MINLCGCYIHKMYTSALWHDFTQVSLPFIFRTQLKTHFYGKEFDHTWDFVVFYIYILYILPSTFYYVFIFLSNNFFLCLALMYSFLFHFLIELKIKQLSLCDTAIQIIFLWMHICAKGQTFIHTMFEILNKIHLKSKIKSTKANRVANSIRID